MQLETANYEELNNRIALLTKQRDRLLGALQQISRGEYDNAHDCKTAARIAHAAIVECDEE